MMLFYKPEKNSPSENPCYGVIIASEIYESLPNYLFL